ncbi:MAG TPA: hypothetical protein VNW54_01925 [Granulicella sp.]|jgi:hypothetical protein|nr:hypothetical protein [Granulicella sp.]
MADDINAVDSTASGPQRAVEELYLRNFEYIRELIHADPRMTFDEEEKIVQGIAQHLSNFDGPLTDKAFQKWATKALLPVLGFYAIKRTSKKNVRSAIRRVFAGCRDLGVTPDLYKDAEQDTWVWSIEHLDELLDPNQRAMPSTRLGDVARDAARTIKKRLLTAKKRFGDVDPEIVGYDEEDRLLVELISEQDTNNSQKSGAAV